MLEEMRDARDAGVLVARSDTIEEVQRRTRNGVILLYQYSHSVLPAWHLNRIAYLSE